MLPLTEQYRPARWSELLGQPKALAQLDRLRKRGLGGRAILFSGKSGTGKTSAALILARELCGSMVGMNCEQIAGKNMVAGDVDRLVRALQSRGMGEPGGRVVIVDECQDMTPSVVKAMLVALDNGNIPSHVTWIFTTTCVIKESKTQKSLFGELGDDCKAWYGRLAAIEFTSQGLAPLFAARAKEIATAEGLDGQPLERYVRLVNDCNGSMRETLQKIELGAMVDE